MWKRKQAKTIKPPTGCTVKDLLKHIDKTIKSDLPEEWYVGIDEFEMEIDLINSRTKKIRSIGASRICYGS